MQAIREANGNVTFKLDAGDADMLAQFQQQAQHNVDHEVLASMLDHFGYAGNARYMPIMPADVGALTDAPMFADEVDYQDGGALSVTGDVWWYPAYEGSSFSEQLLEKGHVTFTKALH